MQEAAHYATSGSTVFRNVTNELESEMAKDNAKKFIVLLMSSQHAQSA